MTSQSDPLAGFGANEWLVQEIYQNYLDDPDSVDPVWREFLADYVPGPVRSTTGRLAEWSSVTAAARTLSPGVAAIGVPESAVPTRTPAPAA